MNNAAVVILAGGQSQRMGFPKLLLPFSCNNNFIEQIVSIYLQVIREDIFIILNETVKNNNANYFSQMQGVNIILNSSPELGRTFSIKLGLERINANKIFIQNTDNPFVTKKLLYALISQRTENGYVSPLINGKGAHPILLCGEAIETVKNASNELSLKDVLSSCYRKNITVNNALFTVNIDTPEIYKQYFPDLQFPLQYI